MGEVARIVDGALISGDPSTAVAGACIDSRLISPGDLFVALPGEQTDGHAHVEQALASGAAGALVQSSWAAGAGSAGALIGVDDPLAGLQAWAAEHLERLGAKIVGVTGTNGKTTTKELPRAALGGGGRIGASLGNFNNQIGLPLSALSFGSKVDTAVLEMGMSTPGEIARLVQIAPPEVVVITNIGPAHLESLGSVEAIARAKLEIMDQEPALAVLPCDAPRLLDEARDRLGDRQALRTFGTEREADYRATDIEAGAGGVTRFLVNGRGPVRLRLPGAHNVLNALAAIAVAERFGSDWEAIREGLRAARPAPMRSERLSIGGVDLINDAYNANPASMAAAISALAALPASGRRALVLGDMLELGELSPDYHRGVGLAADSAGVDLLITVGALSEQISAAAGRLSSRGQVHHFEDPTDAAEFLASWADRGDLVLVKASRGMALERLIDRFASVRAAEGGGS
ncbi:MAG: hypothetical protein CME06_16560 [Gemmatimonadetes bacterium]|nr:hypothetical protein [Gemmatimonadota bacterium]